MEKTKKSLVDFTDKDLLREILLSKNINYRILKFNEFRRLKFNHFLFEGTGETLLRNYFGVLHERKAKNYEEFIFEILFCVFLEDLDKKSFQKLKSVFILSENPEEIYQKKETKKQIANILATLTSKEEMVVKMRFGIGTERDYSLREIGKQLSVTGQMIRQIETRALCKLRHPSRAKMLKPLI